MPTRKSKRKQALVKPSGQPLDYGALVTAIEQTHQQAQRQAVQVVNVALTLRNWLIGYHVVEYEQHGSDRAKYGERLLETCRETCESGWEGGSRGAICFCSASSTCGIQLCNQ
jgi:hypothetical protein